MGTLDCAAVAAAILHSCAESKPAKELEEFTLLLFSSCFAVAFKYKIKVILTERIEMLYGNI